MTMKKAKNFLLIVCCLFFVTSLSAEKIGENILFKKENMSPTEYRNRYAK